MTRADVRHLVMAALFLASALVWAVTPSQAAEPRWTAADTHAAIEAVDPEYRGWVRSTIACETGHTFDPYATAWNDGGYGPSRGVAQINDRLQGAHFRGAGYSDPYNPYEATEYLWRALRGDYQAEGIGYWRWSCA